MAEIKKLLDDAIETEINNLNSASDKDEKSEVIKNLAALHKLRIEEIKTETEIEEKSERRAMDTMLGIALMKAKAITLAPTWPV